jgi:hypothetical protein
MEKHSVARRIGAPPEAALLPNIVPLSTRALKGPTNTNRYTLIDFRFARQSLPDPRAKSE